MRGRQLLCYSGCLGAASGAHWVAVSDPESGCTLTAHEVTEVKFRSLTAEEIAAYVATGEPLDKAGAYGIQDKGALLVERIQGCYFNVVGLPLVKLAGLLARCGVDLLKKERESGHEVPPNVKGATPRIVAPGND